ncbi:hypothetical protein ACWD7F_14380 [Streptomyces sp. NPDC005122]
MLRFHPTRWAAILLTAFALLTPAFEVSGNTTDSVVAGAPAPDDMIWG